MTRTQVVRVTTLGRFCVHVGGMPLAFGRKAPLRPLALLKYLVAGGGSEIADAAVAEALWPDRGARSMRSLAINLHRLRRLLGSDEIVIHRERHIAIDPRHVWCDAVSFERMLDLAARSDRNEERARLTRRALALYRGDFLPGEAREDWIVSVRARLRERYERACTSLAAELESVSDL
jgi:LuxR family maltose regulon positive regulatory protein